MSDPLVRDSGNVPERGGEGFLTHTAEAALRAERDRYREALKRAIYHADNLRRYIEHVPVRDLDESEAGFELAREALEGPADANQNPGTVGNQDGMPSA